MKRGRVPLFRAMEADVLERQRLRCTCRDPIASVVVFGAEEGTAADDPQGHFIDSGDFLGDEFTILLADLQHRVRVRGYGGMVAWYKCAFHVFIQSSNTSGDQVFPKDARISANRSLSRLSSREAVFNSSVNQGDIKNTNHNKMTQIHQNQIFVGYNEAALPPQENCIVQNG